VKLSWFRDGTKLLASGPAGLEERKGIWAISVVGGTIRKLRDDAWGASPSPDGSRVAFYSANEIWVMEADGEEPRRVTSLEKGDWFDRLNWSPDGQRLAYLKRRRGSNVVAIESCDLKTGETSLILSDRRVRDFCWAPDGRIIYSLFESWDQSTTNLWETKADSHTGRTSGEPRRLTNWSGFVLYDLSITADSRRLAFVRGYDQTDVYVAELEGNGTRMKAPSRLTLDERMDWPGGWTHDSKNILFFSDRNGGFDIFRQGVRDRLAEVIATGGEEKRSPQLSPDDNWTLYLAWPRAQGDAPPMAGRLMRVPMSGGSPEVLVEAKGYPGSARAPRERLLPSARGYPDFRCPAVPSDTCILAEADQNQIVFSVLDPVRGTKGELTRLDIDPSDTFWDLSPDGSAIAFGKFDERHGSLRILPVRTGSPREVVVKAWSHLNSVGWSADGKALYVANWSAHGGSLLRVGLNGVTEPLPQAGPGYFERPIASPDGRWLAFGKVISSRNVWMIQDF